MRQRLLDTPQERIPVELAEQVRAFCEPLDVIVASYVGLTEIEEDFKYPREQLAVAFELRAASAHNREDDPTGAGSTEPAGAEAPALPAPERSAMQRVAERFYESMPADVVAGGCNFIGPGAIAAWREKAWQVFAR